MALPEFAGEAEFRARWINPFLQKLGYTMVTHSHGPDEHGKDHIFADFDRFEHVRFLSAQAKLGNVGAGDVELEKLLHQITRAFTVKLRYRPGMHEQRISAVYVMATGTISPEARKFIHDSCAQEHFGGNVYFLDGERLDHLDRYASYTSAKEVLARLKGLAAEITYNFRTLGEMEANFENETIAFSRLRLSGVERCLAGLSHADESLYERLNAVWQSCTFLNAVLDTATIMINLKDWRLTVLREARRKVVDLDKAVQETIERITTQYVIKVSIEG